MQVLLVAVVPAWALRAAAELLVVRLRLRSGCPFPTASGGMPGPRNPCGIHLAALPADELSKGCGCEAP
eukprot:11541227-Heterocapsa_arctica.AAC.1